MARLRLRRNIVERVGRGIGERRHGQLSLVSARWTRLLVVGCGVRGLGRLGAVPGQREEHVVEVGRVDLEASPPRCRRGRGCRRPSAANAPRRRSAPAGVSSASDRADSANAASAADRAASSAKTSSMCPPGTSFFSSAGVPDATILPLSSTATMSASSSASSRYCVVRKMVTPSATRRRTMSHMVRRLRGSRPAVGSSRKTMRGVTDERHREVEPALHAARVGGERLLRGLDEVELLEQLGDARAGDLGFGRWRRRAMSCRFSSPVMQAVDRRELAGQADHGAHVFRVADDVVAAHPGDPAIRTQQRRQDVHDRRLAGAVRAEQGVDGAGRDREVDAVEHDLVAVALAQAGHLDGGAGGCGGCAAARGSAAVARWS